jgi:hypothetical protein
MTTKGPISEVFDHIEQVLLEAATRELPGVLFKTGALAVSDSDAAPRVVLVALSESYGPALQSSSKDVKILSTRNVSCIAHIWGSGETQEAARDQIETVLIPATIKAFRTFKTTSVAPDSGQWATEQTPGYRHDGALYLLTFHILCLVTDSKQTARVTGTTLSGEHQRGNGSLEGVVPKP